MTPTSGSAVDSPAGAGGADPAPSPTGMRVAAAAGHFGRDVELNLHRIEAMVREAAAGGVDLLVLPHGILSGYHDHLDVLVGGSGVGGAVPGGSGVGVGAAADADRPGGGPDSSGPDSSGPDRGAAADADRPGGGPDSSGPDSSGPDGTGRSDGAATFPERIPGARPPDLPPAHRLDGPEMRAVADTITSAGGPVVCFGITEDVDGERANTAVCVGPGGAVLGTHRKVHLPAGEVAWYRAGDGFAAVDTPVGRLGLLVDYDKTFPEAARCLALDGADVLVCPSAWPASRTNRADSLARDRQRRLFDLYDRARAAENQLWLVSANQTGRHGAMRFLGQSKVVRPDGEVVAAVGARAGLAVADIEVGPGVDRARRRFHHLKERRPDLYASLVDPPAGGS